MDSRFSATCAEKVDCIVIIIILMIVVGNFVLEFVLEQTILGHFWVPRAGLRYGYLRVL
jgi:hypothetical protein